MITITQDQSDTITQTIEDAVEYLCQDLYESGTPLAGETVWKVVQAYAATKEAEFQGQLVN